MSTRIPFNSAFTHYSAIRHAFLMSLVVLVSACGGSGGDSAPASNPADLIIGGPSGGDASTLSDDQIRQTAARHASAGLRVNLGNVSDLASVEQQNQQGVNGIFNVLPEDTGMEGINGLEDDSDSFLTNSLGIDDAGARTTRTGNIITIDPDDQTLCDDDFPLASGLNDDPTICQQLVSDLTVQINAVSAEAGIITYLFQNSPFLLVGYSPLGASYELKLAGVLRVSQREAQLAGFSIDSTAEIAGALRFEAMILNDEPGNEAGELSLKVTEAIQISSAVQPEGLNLQPSTVFELASDQTTQDVSMRIDWGALQVISSSVDDSNENTSLLRINLGGLSAALDFNEAQPSFQVSNIGIGGVPLTVTVDSIESVNLSLANFGITVDEQTGTINLDGALNASLMLNNFAGLISEESRDFTVNANLSAPANTQLLEQENGSTQVVSGGPVSATLMGGDGTQSVQSEVMINTGECFDSDNSEGGAAPSLIALVACDN